MPHLKAVTQLFMTSGIVEDAAVNTFHFQCLSTEDEYGIITDALVNFFDTMRLELSGKVAQNGHRLKIYDMADDEPRAPVWDVAWNLTSAPAGGPQASEVALCLSFQGDRVSGVEQATRRGRIYLGPLDTTVVDTDGRPASAFVTKLAEAGNTLRLEVLSATPSVLWCVYSPTLETMTPVTNGWVDNAFDIQRRRGLAPSSRLTFP